MRTAAIPLRKRLARRRQGGFSLIEVLVALLIGLIATVIMMEILISSEERNRTSNTGNDSVSNGAVMMHLLQRDLAQAGYGINSTGLLGCNLELPNGKVVPLAPVVVNPAAALVPAGDANTDTLLIFYGNTNSQPEGNEILVPPAGGKYTVQSITSFNENDYVIATNGGCTANLKLAKIAAPSASDITPDKFLAGATTVFNVGAAPRVVAYAIRNGALSSCDYMQADCSVVDATTWTAVAGNIVSLRAQYGRDTKAPTMDGMIDTWDQTTPGIGSGNGCNWARVEGVRLALVAKSTQYATKIDAATKQRVGEAVTATAPDWNGSAGAPIVLSANPDGSPRPDWQNYRYRTFETVTPFRNVVWMGANSGC